MEWETVIGLEIHAQLATKSKIFSGAATAYGAEPNTQACAIDLGLPGVLPVLNREAVRMAAMLGLAIGAQIARRSVFARKNYFYPDLPKGYQISQYELPVVQKGQLTIDLEDGSTKRIGVTRAHLEEDAGKSLHEDFHGLSGIDLNRAGTPLLEIVSEPDLRSAKEAVAYMKKLHQLVVYLGICDGNMQEGSFRCDANVSVRRKGDAQFGTRAEIKNLNSFRFVERAIEFEVERQIELIEAGGKVVQETRLYDPERGETRSMRSKEEANDYRYFPDPDLLPLILDEAFIDAARAELPELPEAKKQRFITQYQLSGYDAAVLTTSRALADYYEATAKAANNAKAAANWMLSELLRELKNVSADITQAKVSAENLGALIRLIDDQTISGKIAKEVFAEMIVSGAAPDAIIHEKGLVQITDTAAIEKIVDEIIAANPQQVEKYRAGRTALMGFFVGQTLKASGGKANPQMVNEIVKQKLG